jgi:hypothetical protein
MKNKLQKKCVSEDNNSLHSERKFRKLSEFSGIISYEEGEEIIKNIEENKVLQKKLLQSRIIKLNETEN